MADVGLQRETKQEKKNAAGNVAENTVQESLKKHLAADASYLSFTPDAHPLRRVSSPSGAVQLFTPDAF